MTAVAENLMMDNRFSNVIMGEPAVYTGQPEGWRTKRKV
jgi:hypothetical protein